eukprot:3075655-Alexandrium_andersonii.AAC.1
MMTLREVPERRVCYSCTRYHGAHNCSRRLPESDLLHRQDVDAWVIHCATCAGNHTVEKMRAVCADMDRP